ncbi:MAG: hypothetical protein JST54_26945 [Deltaproteobacteria bacterium]|nr:hypothetical protein [Deltaproteobacteria bacterium]
MSTPGHICAACPKAISKTCCQPGEPHGLATLTGGDIARIREATRKPARHFVDEEAFGPLEAHGHAQLRPANANAIVRGVRRHLRAWDGACVFHSAESGCSLSADVRPLACRLYPFEVDAHGQVRLVIAGRCHAEEALASPKEVLAALGLDEASVRALHDQLCEELLHDARLAGE